MWSFSVIVGSNNQSWGCISEIIHTQLDSHSVKLHNAKICSVDVFYFTINMRGKCLHLACIFLGHVSPVISIIISLLFVLYLFSPKPVNSHENHQKALLSHNLLLLPQVVNSAAQTQNHPSSMQPPVSTGSLDAKQARKMTSMLSLLPWEVSPTQRDVAITYHHQKVLVWW